MFIEYAIQIIELFQIGVVFVNLSPGQKPTLGKRVRKKFNPGPNGPGNPGIRIKVNQGKGNVLDVFHESKYTKKEPGRQKTRARRTPLKAATGRRVANARRTRKPARA